MYILQNYFNIYKQIDNNNLSTYIFVKKMIYID